MNDDDNIELFEANWQFECHVCHGMSDCFESRWERDAAAAKHECTWTVRYGNGHYVLTRSELECALKSNAGFKFAKWHGLV